MGFYSTGSLTTATKSFSRQVTPDFVQLAYTLNGESITLTAIGSPGTASEEQVSQSLDGSSSYSLSWNDSHTDFRIKIELSTNDTSTTPEMDSVTLEDAVSSGDPDQNPQTTWEILGAEYDSSGNEYEGGGVISRYGG